MPWYWVIPTFVIAHWRVISGLFLFFSGSITIIGKLIFDQIKADKQACDSAFTELQRTTDAISGISGRAGAVDQDCDRCRSSNTYRRHTGEAFLDIFGDEKFTPLRPFLTAFDKAAGRLEDGLQADPPLKAPEITMLRDDALTCLSSLREEAKKRIKTRISHRLFGRHPMIAAKDKKSED
jgi:hypothetical protein